MNPDSTKPKRVIIAGASNMRRIVPLLRAAGYIVIDFTQPSWLATPDNLAILADKLNKTDPDENTVVVLELFGNSTIRYRQFDGTLALPFKASNGYHLEGEVSVCEDDVFLKLVATTHDILKSVAQCVKIVIPPLPRHLYTPCCGNRKHCTNSKSEGFELGLLHATTHFRPILKDSLMEMGVTRFFVLDGIGGILGIPAGENRGAASEIVRDLKQYCGPDGVHYTEPGYANLARTVISAIEGVQSGTLTKASVSKNVSGQQGGVTFFWRGFVSPVGYAGGKAGQLQESKQYAREHSSDRSWRGGHAGPIRGDGAAGGGAHGEGGRGRGRHTGAHAHRGPFNYAGFRRGGARGMHGSHPYNY
jgi:hypothetical protein